MTWPLVSAIMPTRGRVGRAHDAVRMFREQSYPNKELVIVDDLMEPSFASGVVAGAIYSRAPRLLIGEKRNLCVSRATGAIIMHWDSDDTYRSDRMEHQAKLLLEKRDEGYDLVGYNTMHFEDVDLGKHWMYRGSRPIGVSQTYWADAWEKRPFDPINVGEDSAFASGLRWFCCDADDRIIGCIHHGNTSNKRVEIPGNAHQWIPMSRDGSGKWRVAA